MLEILQQYKVHYAKECTLSLLKTGLKQAQHYMAQPPNRHRPKRGRKKVVPYHSQDLKLQFDGVKKLIHRYFCPFKVCRRVGTFAYQLELPVSVECHIIFHVSLLKLYKKGGLGVVLLPPVLLPSGASESEPKMTIGHSLRPGRPKCDDT